MTGDDHALPEIEVFHLTLFVSLQVKGRPVAVDCPSPVGPRNWGQSHSERTLVAVSNSPLNARALLKLRMALICTRFGCIPNFLIAHWLTRDACPNTRQR